MVGGADCRGASIADGRRVELTIVVLPFIARAPAAVRIVVSHTYRPHAPLGSSHRICPPSAPSDCRRRRWCRLRAWRPNISRGIRSNGELWSQLLAWWSKRLIDEGLSRYCTGRRPSNFGEMRSARCCTSGSTRTAQRSVLEHGAVEEVAPARHRFGVAPASASASSREDRC